MLKIVFSSDWHLGLKTNDIDRTDEIYGIAIQLIDHCKKLIDDGDEVYLILGGDIFDCNTPSEKHIATFIKVLGLIKVNEIKTFVMVGNHEAIADPKRLSCLSFVKAAKEGYPTVTLIEDIKTMKIGVYDTGPLYFTFLPHISKALIANKVAKKALKSEIPTQKYINMKSERIAKKLGENTTNFVFSHLNVHGAHGGSEENLLKKSEVYLPKVFTDCNTGMVNIIQGHIHSRQKIGNIDIIGSPIYCSFGEKLESKYFVEYEVPSAIGKDIKAKYIKTKHRPFMELEVDMMSETLDFFSLKDVIKFLKEVKTLSKDGFKPIVKFDVTINPENNTYNWAAIRERVQEEYDCEVKQIIPRIIIKRPIRSVKQKLGMPVKESVKVFLNRNLKGKEKKMKLIWKYSQQYMEIK